MAMPKGPLTARRPGLHGAQTSAWTAFLELTRRPVVFIQPSIRLMHRPFDFTGKNIGHRVPIEDPHQLDLPRAKNIGLLLPAAHAVAFKLTPDRK